MTKHTLKIFKISALILALSVSIIGLGKLAGALTYSSDLGISFTFLPTLKVTLSATGCNSTTSTANICIDNLAPGTVSDSNVININVLSNASNGYTLNATVGNNTTYNTRNLISSDTNVTSNFASLDFGSSITANTSLSDNQWGYAYKDESLTNSAWSSYSGLPLYSDTTNIATLKATTTPVTNATGDDIKFKIAAKASEFQQASEYNNVINFTVTAQPIPVTLYMAYENAGAQKFQGYFKMQDMTSAICSAADVVDEASQMQAIDIRDGKLYWITKLQDGKCWMTQNLDLDLDENRTYTPDDTDIPVAGKPIRSTIKVEQTGVDSIGSVIGFQENTTEPFSVDPGDWYWKNSPWYDPNICKGDGSWDVSGRPCDFISKMDPTYANYFSQTPYASNGMHGHVGNYYNWTAAIGINDSSSYTSNTYGNIANNPQTSICPAGWRLPAAASNLSQNDIYLLAMYYNGGNTTVAQPSIEAAPVYLNRAGDVRSRLYGVGWAGPLISSTVVSATEFYNINNQTSGRDRAFPVRCIAR